MMNFRDAILRHDRRPVRRQEGEIGFVNFHVPKAKLRDETIKFAKKLMEKESTALRYTREAVRAVRFMNEPQAQDYLNAKSDALKLNEGKTVARKA